MSALDQLVYRRSQAVPKMIELLRRRDGLVQQPIAAVAGPRVRVRGRWVLNFASTNYLGLSRDMRVVSAMVRAAITWGVSLATPRVLAVDDLTTRLETAIARLVGQERALVFPSTTQVALDVLPLLAGCGGVIFADEWAYPLSLEGAYAATRGGAQVCHFPHDDYRALAIMLRDHAAFRDKIVVCDGVYPAHGRLAALREIERAARMYDAVVYVDDAPGIGLLGAHPTARMPYGYGGGGTLHHLGVPPGRVVHVGSLSQAFGVPVAFVAGPARFIAYLRDTSATYTHSSPPALPVLAAALAALHVHAVRGALLRERLAGHVRHFRAGLAHTGRLPDSHSLFPIQMLYFDTEQAAETAGRELLRRDIWAVLQYQPPERPAGAALRLVLTAAHDEADIQEAIAAIVDVLRTCRDSANSRSTASDFVL